MKNTDKSETTIVYSEKHRYRRKAQKFNAICGVGSSHLKYDAMMLRSFESICYLSIDAVAFEKSLPVSGFLVIAANFDAVDLLRTYNIPLARLYFEFREKWFQHKFK